MQCELQWSVSLWSDKLQNINAHFFSYSQRWFKRFTWECCISCIASDLSVTPWWVLRLMKCAEWCESNVTGILSSSFSYLLSSRLVEGLIFIFIVQQVPLLENIQYPEYHEGTTAIMSVYMRMWVFIFSLLDIMKDMDFSFTGYIMYLITLCIIVSGGSFSRCAWCMTSHWMTF